METVEIDISSVKGGTCGKYISPGYGRHSIRTLKCWELIFVIKGTLYMFEEAQSFTVNEGEALILNSDRLHGSTQEYSRDLQFYWLHFTCEQTKTDPVLLSKHSTPQRKSRVIQLLNNYLADKQQGFENDTAYNLIAQLLLIEVSHSTQLNLSQRNPLALKTKNYIHTHVSDGLKSSDVATALGYSADYIERVFKKEFGRTITHEIQNARLFYCSQLLLNSSFNVSQIALLGGFSSVEDFCRVFKKHKSLSPTEYKAKNTNDKINII